MQQECIGQCYYRRLISLSKVYPAAEEGKQSPRYGTCPPPQGEPGGGGGMALLTASSGARECRGLSGTEFVELRVLDRGAAAEYIWLHEKFEY